MATEPAPPRIGQTHRWVKIGLVMALSTLTAIAILPAYVTGQWPWITPPRVSQLEQLHTLQDQGLQLPGWTLIGHQSITVNRQDWTVSEYQRANNLPLKAAASFPVDHIALIMHPQSWHSNQPEVEWLDLNSAQNLRITSRQPVTLTTTFNRQPVNATARFTRSQNPQRTFAMLQWYAWPTGGHPSPRAWFWANQWSQLTSHSLTPWIAITLLIPIEPLADVANYQSLAVDLGSSIQQQLAARVFPPES